MVLLAIVEAPIWEPGNALLKDIIADLPALVFVEFVKNLHNAAMSIRKILNFHYFSEDPSSLGVLAINKHVLFDFILRYSGFVVEMLMHKLSHVCLKLIGIQLIRFSHFQVY